MKSILFTFIWEPTSPGPKKPAFFAPLTQVVYAEFQNSG